MKGITQIKDYLKRNEMKFKLISFQHFPFVLEMFENFIYNFISHNYCTSVPGSLPHHESLRESGSTSYSIYSDEPAQYITRGQRATEDLKYIKEFSQLIKNQKYI